MCPVLNETDFPNSRDDDDFRYNGIEIEQKKKKTKRNV